MKNRKKIFIGIGGLMLLFLLVGIIIFYTGSDELKGRWDLDGTTAYEFDGNGKGSMVLPLNKYPFQYTIDKKEKKISIDFEDEKASDYTYSYVVDADYLTLYGNIGKETSEYVFTKQKQNEI